MIPQETINSILQATRIEDVVGSTVKLTRKGASYKGLCPFHGEKTPSFTVTPAKGIWHCFGCGEGGDVFKFVMKNQGVQFPDAVKILAQKVNIKIEEVEEDPEAKKRSERREQMFLLNEFAAKYFQQQLVEFDKIQKIAVDRFGTESVSMWRIGYARDEFKGFYDTARAAGYREDFLIDAGLVKRSEKKNNVYDVFRHRIMFPIFNYAGRITGFSGRQIETTKENPKYINTSDTEIYRKHMELYGINFAGRVMHSDGAMLVEGNPDVIRLHQVGPGNAIAPCGTAVTEEQLKLIRKYTNVLTIMTDGDSAGQKAMLKTGKLAIDNDFRVYCVVLPEKEDPDSFFKDEEIYKSFMEKERKDWILVRAAVLFDKIGQDPGKKNEAIKELCGYIHKYDDVTRQIYASTISDEHKVKPKLFADRLKDMDQSKTEYEVDESLPPGVDARDFERWGFYEHHNCYYMRTKSGVEEVSNFIMRPVFHIEGQDSRRVYELVNFRGYRIVVDLDMQEMTSIQAFRRNIEGRGNFIFSGTDAQFTRIKSKLYEETRTCREIRVLGWQKEGFFAWANGITTEEGYTEIDEYGIVEFNKQNYFIPAFSKIHIDDKSVFIGERKFQYKSRDITMAAYTDLFYKVFGDNSRMGVCFWVATVFRDYILFLNKNFPILNLFGPKGTGKSQMAMSLSCLFGEQQTPFNIHNGTKPGLAEHMQQFSNAFAWVDEYKNNLDYEKIETLKSIYDAIGRNRLNIEKRKETTLVNAAMILSGQEMPTADVALFSRLIFLQFHKTEYTDQEKKLYDKLKQMERDGLSHLTAQLLAHRRYFEKEFWSNTDFVISDIFDEMREDGIEDRILRSWCTVAAAMKTLQNRIDFGFTYNDIRPLIIKGIKEQNGQVARSNEIGQFWELIEAMFDEGMLIEKWHFRLDYLDNLKTNTGIREFSVGRDVLRFKFTTISKFYAEQARRSGLKPLPGDTLSYYLRNSKPFLGISSSVKFYKKEWSSAESKVVEEKTITSAYCFDYKMVGINLSRAMVGEMLKNEDESDEPDSMIRHAGVKHIEPSASERSKNELFEADVLNVVDDKDLPF